MRIVLNLNPNARFGNVAGDQTLDALRQRGIEIVRIETRRPDRAGDLPPCDAIVAVGGDGTLLAAIGQAVTHDVPLGIVPAGTFNELARTLHIPLAVAGACDAIAQGFTRRIDVATVNGHYYVNEASIGISSRAARLQTGEIKRKFGFAGIVATAIHALRYARPMFAELQFDGKTITSRTVQLTIANSDRFGGMVEVSDAAIDDGWLDAFTVEISGLWDAFSVAHAVLRGRRASVRGLRTFRSKQFTVRQHRAHHIAADGEPAGKTPAVFRVLPKALAVFVPQP